MIRSQKETSVQQAKDILANNAMCIFVNYKGLTAKAVSNLRTSLKDKNANMKVFKNTLFAKAIEGTEYAFLKDYLVDQIAVSYSQDPIALSNVINTFIKDNDKVTIQVVAMDGKQADVSVVKEMASLGSMEDVRARFIGVLKGAGSKLVGVLEAYNKKLEA